MNPEAKGEVLISILKSFWISESSSNPFLETPHWALGAFRESFSVWCICPDSSYIPPVFDYLQVFLLSVCTEVCYKQYEIGSVPSEVFWLLLKRHKHGANGRGKGKFGILDLFFIFLRLFLKYPLHCVPLIWVSWGTFCLADVIACLCLSCVCGIYESQPGSSVIFLSGWRCEHFRTRQRGEQGWQATSWNLSVFSFLLRCVFCDGRCDKRSGVYSSGAAILEFNEG